MNRRRSGRTVASTAVLALAAALFAIPSAAPAADAATAAPAAHAQHRSSPAAAFKNARGGKGTCDPIAASACGLPFPNDWYTKPDQAAVTGRSLAYTKALLPKTTTGSQMPPAALNRNDGFSPGSVITTLAPGVDLDRSGMAPITDIASSLDSGAPVVLVDMKTGERRPYWAELDTRATDPTRQALLVHPSSNLEPGHRYAVGLRGLVDSKGKALTPTKAFRKLRGPALRAKSPLRSRQTQLKPVFKALAAAGVKRSGLYQAWGFTVASQANLASDVITMRDQSFANLQASPTITVTEVQDFTAEENANLARVVTGTVQVPNYLSTDDAQPGGSLVRAKDGLPQEPDATRVTAAEFVCTIPRVALTDPGTPSLYGHGLLGSAGEVKAGNVQQMAQEHDFVFCATPWIGISEEDQFYDASALSDPSLFPNVIDRMKQGLLNAMFVGRALGSADGMAALPAFQNDSGQPVVDTGQQLVYDGNSQGGIMGGALVATSPDIDYGVLGVPGMNYSVLLDRSSDFVTFGAILAAAFPSRLDQQLMLLYFQILWDRGEADGYAHLLATSKTKRVLLHVAFGDHQVANIAAETEARTIGARISSDPIAPGRNPDVTPYWGIQTIPAYPYAGSAIVIWDSGSPAAPPTNTPPTEGRDPHSDPRKSSLAREQKAEFLRTGTVIDVCAGAPCTADPG